MKRRNFLATTLAAILPGRTIAANPAPPDPPTLETMRNAMMIGDWRDVTVGMWSGIDIKQTIRKDMIAAQKMRLP